MNNNTLRDINLRCRQVMAIVNVTGDSFYAAGRAEQTEDLVALVARHIADGASIIDVGGYSSRPGADEVSLEEEWRRVDRGIAAVRSVDEYVPVSVDTFRSEVVRRAVAKFGEVIVNDITGGDGDGQMWQTVAELGVPYVLMHMRGTPQTMQNLTAYDDVVSEVFDELLMKAERMQACGVRAERIVLDPGFGFAKTLEQNYTLLRCLSRLCEAGYPVLVGVSRKSMITRLLDISSDEALCGTQVLGWEALRQGASILRVHDVREAVHTVKMYEAYIKR